jgi:hypothetical protein
MSLLIFFYKSYVTENQILRLKHPILNQNQPFLSFCDIQAHIVSPIFTGKTELELPRTLKRLAKKEFVDVYPMVWKDFRKKGYVTAWAEDCPHIGTSF